MTTNNKPAHQPVLLKETMNYLRPERGGNFLDATVGYGGHAEKILKTLKLAGKPYHFFGIDLDRDALAYTAKKLHSYCSNASENYKTSSRLFVSNHITLLPGNFRQAVLLTKPTKFDGILLDLGVSSPQLADPTYGISFQHNSPLDMRFDQSQSPGRHTLTAWQIVNHWPYPQLAKLFRQLGEEQFARQIAHQIVLARRQNSINTTFELIELVKRATPPAYRFGRQTHFATNIFRALRQAVNNELGALESLLKQLPNLCQPGCRVVLIAFHSLEDRLVKRAFQDYEDRDLARILTKKPLLSDYEECQRNPRARSAKLRAIEWR